MKHRLSFRRDGLIALGILIAASACERAAPPTAARETSVATFARSPGQFKSFRIPLDNSMPRHLALGSDGNMWFTESRLDFGRIGRVDAKGRITEFLMPDPSTQPDDIVAGPDGALWFTGPSAFPNFYITRLTTDGEFTGFAPACDDEFGCTIVADGITSGADGNIWFTERIRNAVVQLTPLGVFTFYTIPTPGANPAGITVGADGALWFTEFSVQKIGRITVAGSITEYTLTSGGSPDRITAGPDGNLWFTEPFPFDSRIGRITPSGVITEFPLAGGAQPRDIVAGPDGNLWFTDYGGDQLGRITTEGVAAVVQSVKGGPWGIARGANGTIWVTQIDGNAVGRFTLAP